MAETLPNPASGDTTRFEVAPDGTLGSRSRGGAGGQAHPRRCADHGEFPLRASRLLRRDLQRTARSTERDRRRPRGRAQRRCHGGDRASLRQRRRELLRLAFLEKTLFVAGILADVLTTSPLLTEQYFRGTMDDGTQVT